MSPIRNRSLTRALLCVVVVAVAVLLAGCGRGSDSSVGGRPVGAPTTIAPTAIAPTTIASPTSEPSVTTVPSDSADLAQVDSDEQVAGAASDQSDADFDGGVAAQAQNDSP